MAQNKMRAKPALPERVRSCQTLGVLNETLAKSKSIGAATNRSLSSASSLLVALHEWSAPAQARSKANASQSVGPLLRGGNAAATRKASVVGRLSSGSEETSGSPSACVSPVYRAHTKLSLPGIWATATVRQCKPKKRSTPRRLTLPSSGLTPAAQAWPSFYSGPSPRRLREPLMSNVRRLGAKTAKESARLERIALAVQVYWRSKERVAQFCFFVSRSPA